MSVKSVLLSLALYPLRRTLLGSDSEGKDMNVMVYANTFASALNVSVDEFVELLPELAGGQGG